MLITGTPAFIVAWTLSGDGGTLASNPPSGLAWPVSQYDRIWKVWLKIVNVAGAQYSLRPLPQLVIDNTTTSVNSYADPANNQVHIYMNLAELISDSESELGFVVGHEMGHMIQAMLGELVWIPSNKELDADEWGLLLSLEAGYDPYGAAGALAKLSMASGQAGLVDQNFDSLSTDPHGSFNDRLALLFTNLQATCAQPIASSACALYKSIFHPHLPPTAPLAVKPKL